MLSNIKANEIDSLKKIISTLTNNTERVDQTNILSEILLTSSEYDSVTSIMRNNIQLAQNLNYKKGEADSCILVYMDPYIENWTGGAPAYKLIINASLAALIFPLHNFFEGRMTKKKKINQ